ncbi:RNA 3'-terminal phosphate cyclase domain-containing protein [Butyriboletus roseoflavus]|nr:RNA 3'-terminal phosphate cyclase domain-containing protein [Butyriboletus roseoflavus]
MLTADPGTAGSTMLLLQVALPCLMLIPLGNRASESQTSHDALTSVLTLRGGTNASLAPQTDYTQTIFLPFLSKHFHFSPTLTINRRGYYPKGGGSVLCTVPSISGPLPPVILTERGQGHAARFWKVGIASTKVSLVSVRERDEDVVGAGGGILLWAETDNGCLIGGSAVSTKEKKPETVGGEAARELVRNLNHGGCVDEYLQDQIIILLALAKGTSIVKTGPLTDHTRTAIHVAQRITGAQFHVDENAPDSAIITCVGIGFIP